MFPKKIAQLIVNHVGLFLNFDLSKSWLNASKTSSQNCLTEQTRVLLAAEITPFNFKCLFPTSFTHFERFSCS